ncbi:MAG: extracellular matrix regulator RemB [Acutalibacteraceae bacterium]|jgi:predicted HAD superfamily phosphohydrolase YqeG
MYIHLGRDTVVKDDEIIGIFDLDSTTISKHTRNFLSNAEKKKMVVNVSYELPKSFIVCNKNKKTVVYISQLSSSTLFKRSEEFNIDKLV